MLIKENVIPIKIKLPVKYLPWKLYDNNYDTYVLWYYS